MARGSNPETLSPLDTELGDLPPELRWREWMGRVEAAIFASAVPVSRAALARLVGEACVLDDLIADIRDELKTRPYDLVAIAGGWQHRTRPRFVEAIRSGNSPFPFEADWTDYEGVGVTDAATSLFALVAFVIIVTALAMSRYRTTLD